MKQWLTICLATALASVAACAHAREYTVLIYETPQVLAQREGKQAPAYWTAYNDFAARLAGAGILRGGTAVDAEAGQPGAAGSASRQPAALQGLLSGYFIIDVPDNATAARWAGQAPTSAARVEVRPHRANPTMAKQG